MSMGNLQKIDISLAGTWVNDELGIGQSSSRDMRTGYLLLYYHTTIAQGHLRQYRSVARSQRRRT